MKRVGRREFAKGAGVVAAVAPLLMNADVVAASVMQTAGKLSGTPLTAEQRIKLDEAIARRDAQLAQLHSRPLPFDLEPAFVFRARATPRVVRKP